MEEKNKTNYFSFVKKVFLDGNSTMKIWLFGGILTFDSQKISDTRVRAQNFKSSCMMQLWKKYSDGKGHAWPHLSLVLISQHGNLLM